MSATQHEKLNITRLEGTVTVAYRQDEDGWNATALEFDLLGIGDTREAALAQLRELVEEYVRAVLATTGRVRFYNPSDLNDYAACDKEQFRLMAVVQRSGRAKPLPQLVGIEDLRSVWKRVRLVELCPESGSHSFCGSAAPKPAATIPARRARAVFA